MPRLAALICMGLTACPVEHVILVNPMSSFKVDLLGVYQRVGAQRVALPIVASCIERYGNELFVPIEVRGTSDCRYLIPRGEVEFDIQATAFGIDGQPFTQFDGSVSFRVLPGDLVDDNKARWAMAQGGKVTATVRAVHPYGSVRVWVEDAASKVYYDGGLTPNDLAPEPPYPAKRSFAAGSTPVIYFEDQTLQSLQLPGDFDNRSSPFAGEFVVVGKDPISGETLKQSCRDDPSRSGRDSLMVVTGIDPSGFFVTDISACRLKELQADSTGSTVRTPEPPEACVLDLPDGGRIESLDGGAGHCNISGTNCTKRSQCSPYSPGTFASMFVYNYNFPEGLDEGDLLFTLSGSVQEFTSTTQLVFPAWTTAERVRRLPEDQWDKWLQYAKPYDLSARTCGQDDVSTVFLTDALCGHNRRNMKMESLESGLVRLRRVRFPQKFQNCDSNGDGTVPFFCETKPENSDWMWSTCNFDSPELEADRVERECNMNCVIGMADHAGTICSEQSTFRGFAQYAVEMALPGPSSLDLDDSLPARMQRVTTTLAANLDGGQEPNPSVRASDYAVGAEVAVTCDKPTRFHFGSPSVVAIDGDATISPGEIIRHVMASGESAVAFQAILEGANCTVGLNARTRINIITKDVGQELNPDCDEADPDEAAAQQCKNLRGSEFNIIGHLRQIQPGRPRWVVIPRAIDDLCCYPGPGLECPRPVRPCK